MRKIPFILLLTSSTFVFAKINNINIQSVDFSKPFRVGNYTFAKPSANNWAVKIYYPLRVKAKDAPLKTVMKAVCKSEGLSCDYSSFEKIKGYISIDYKGTVAGFLKYLHENYGYNFAYTDGILNFEGGAVTANEQTENPLKNILVSLNVNNLPLKDIFKVISLQTGYIFIPQPDVNLSAKASLTVENKPLDEVLEALLLPKGYSYRIEGKIIKLVKTETRVFQIPRIAYKENFSFTAGGSGGQKSVDIQSDFWDDLEKNLQNLISPDGKYAINKEKGIIVVSDKPEVLDRIEEFLNTLKAKSQEVCNYRVGIYEVTFNKGFSSGIDFKRVFYDENNKQGLVQITANSGIVNSFLFSWSKNTATYPFDFIVKLLGTKGKVKTIYDQVVSSACGDTVAILPSEAYKYLEKVEVQTGYQSGLVTQTPVFNTLLLGPQVYITIDRIGRGRYSALINITDRYIKSFKSYTFNQNTYNFPERVGQNQVSLSSIIRRGQIQIIAGFKHYKESVEVNGVPVLMDIPVIGNLFKGTTKNKYLSEYVILIQPY